MTLVKTIGVGGGLSVQPDYTSLEGYLAFLQGLGTFSEDQVGRILWAGSDNEIKVLAALNLASISTGSFKSIFEAGDAFGAAGGGIRNGPNKLTSALRYNPDSGACVRQAAGTSGSSFTINSPNITFRYLQFANSTNDGTAVINDNATGFILDSCVVDSRANSTISNVLLIQSTGAVITNSLVLMSDENASGPTLVKITGDAVFHSCIIACTDPQCTNARAVESASAGAASTFTNTVFSAAGSDYFLTSGTAAVFTNCATNKSAGTSGIAGTAIQYDLVTTTEFFLMTQFQEDFRLISTSVKCRDLGTTTGAPATDIVGTTRDATPDIGIWEYIAPITYNDTLIAAETNTIGAANWDGLRQDPPIADDLVGVWTDQAGGVTNLFAAIDELVIDDSDYVRSEISPAVSVVRFKLGAIPKPQVDTNQTMRYRYRRDCMRRIDQIGRLKEGATVRKTWTDTDITPGEYVMGEVTLTVAEAQSIVDWTNLYLEFEANMP